VKFTKHKYIKHKQTCPKKCEFICRFQYPKPPMKNTKILSPLDEKIVLEVFVK
jgi:hypothetical protein